MAKLYSLNIKGVELKLKTSPGVFSQSGIDTGTKLLIENIEISNKTLVADLGSGGGIIGIICGKLSPRCHIHLLDDHLRSFKLTKENIKLNNITNAQSYLSDLFSAVENRTYHQIFTNPPQQLGNEFLEELINECFKHLKPQGQLCLVVKKNYSNFIKRLLDKTFSNSQVIKSSKNHTVLKSRKI